MRLIILLVILLSPMAMAADSEASMDKSRAECYANELKVWGPLAEQGDVDAQIRLGLLLDIGCSDRDDSVRWLTMAAEQGNAGAQAWLGMRYAEVQNMVAAYAWWNIAAAQGDEFAMKNLKDSADWVTSEQIAEAQKLTSELYEKINGESP